MPTLLYSGPVAGTPFAKPDFTRFAVDDTVTVSPEPSNQYDPNAHLVTCNGIKLGYIPKVETYRYRTSPVGLTKITSINPSRKWSEITIETYTAE